MWDKVGTNNWRRPLLLQADNFTPPRRTPWGGRRIVADLKASEGLVTKGPVGEAWELSVEPDFPSRLEEGPKLDTLLRSDSALLGREASLGSTALLVKLVDAAEHLSLQIHPGDDDPALDSNESGKPEAWYIVDADDDAGLYLGFREGVTPEEVRTAIDERGAVDSLMTFVPVSAGDLFLIEPGTPHAIGAGVFLLEPQRVAPGKRGVTYRYWDWNRTYDADGQPDPNGAPRELHAARALEVTNWAGPRGAALVDRIRYPAGAPARGDSASLEALCGPTGPLRSKSFVLQRLTGTGHVELPADDRLRALTVLDGAVTLLHEQHATRVPRGRTAALPANLGRLSIELDRAHAMLCTLA
jgi:mannose-6-phosphate isomerase class I